MSNFLDRFQIIAHRGDRDNAPENTLRAFELAKDAGAQSVEFDATLTATPNSPVVIFHDDTVGRTTNMGADRALDDVSFADLRALDAGSWFNLANPSKANPHNNGQQVPTLAETVRRCEALGLAMNIEIKVPENNRNGSPEPYRDEQAIRTASRVAEDLVATRPNRQFNDIVLSSFSTPALLEAKARFPEVPRGYLLHQMWDGDVADPKMPEFSRRLREIQPATVNLNADLVQAPGALDRFQTTIRREMGRDLPILCYTVNDVGQAGRLFSQGVHGIFTDDPRTMLKANVLAKKAGFRPF